MSLICDGFTNDLLIMAAIDKVEYFGVASLLLQMLSFLRDYGIASELARERQSV